MSRVEVAPGSTEHTLTYCVMLEQSPEGFKEFVIRAAGPAQRRVLFQELKEVSLPGCLLAFGENPPPFAVWKTVSPS